MPKKAYLANYYSSEELKQKYLKTQAPVEALVMASNLESVFGLDY